jgi:hypothetical protein
MSTIDLLQPLFTDGIASPSYFNGRVLSAEDLAQESGAWRHASRLLGQAIGDGIVQGLEVSIAPGAGPTVRVEAGLAINRRGAPALLGSFQLVRLTPAAPAVGGAPGFAECGEPAGTPFTGSAGVYVLTIGPVQGNRGLAPVTGLRNVTAACNVREVVDGVQFRMIPLVLGGVDPASNRLRSEIAARCLGIEELAALKGYAPGPEIATYGTLDDLRQARVLTDCEVPLAVVKLTGSVVAFVDRWSVRRRPVRRAAEVRWPHMVGDRRLAEAEAFFLQFQDHLTDIAPPGTDARGMEGSAHFTWLPPAGVLPVGGNRFRPESFFKPQVRMPLVADHTLARQVIHDSFYGEPFKANDANIVVQILSFEDHPEYVLYRRIEPPPIQPAPEQVPTTGTGAFDIRVSWDGVSFVPHIEEVWVEDTAGKRFDAAVVPGGAGGSGFGFAILLFQARFQASGLEPGKYLVKVKARNLPIASASATAVSKTSVLVQVRLHPYYNPCPPKRTKPKPVDVIKAEAFDPLVDRTGNRYGSFAVMHDYKTAAATVPATYQAVEQMQISDVKYKELVSIWDCRLELEPQYPVVTDFVIPEIRIDPGYIPNVFPPPDDPYAYLVLEDIAYPLILTPEVRTLPATVPATAAGIPEVSLERYVSTLEPMGLGDLDVLAGGWGGLLQEALDIPQGALATVSGELASGAVTAVNNKLYYPGMTPELGAALSAAALDDVAIANASVAQLTERIEGLEGIEIGHEAATSLATRLVGTARTIVPETAWSLDDPALGFDRATTKAFKDAGLETKGALAGADEAVVLAVTEQAGLTVETVTAAKAQSEVAVAAISAALKPEQSLTDIGFTREQAETLVSSGITSVSGLAATEINLVETLGIEESQASALNLSAVEATTATWGNVSVADTTVLESSLGGLATKPVFTNVAPFLLGRNR